MKCMVQKGRIDMNNEDKILSMLETVISKVDNLEQKFEQKFEGLEQNFKGLEQKFEGLEQNYKELKQGYKKLEQGQAELMFYAQSIHQLVNDDHSQLQNLADISKSHEDKFQKLKEL